MAMNSKYKIVWLLALVTVVLAAVLIFVDSDKSKIDDEVAVLPEKDFEDEADPSTMRLYMKQWEWVKTVMDSGTVVTPNKQGVFTLGFGPADRLEIGTDCNRMLATFTVGTSSISIGPIAGTKMYCEGSQEGEFAAAIAKASSYSFTTKGELHLNFTFGDSKGTLILG